MKLYLRVLNKKLELHDLFLCSDSSYTVIIFFFDTDIFVSAKERVTIHFNLFLNFYKMYLLITLCEVSEFLVFEFSSYSASFFQFSFGALFRAIVLLQG